MCKTLTVGVRVRACVYVLERNVTRIRQAARKFAFLFSKGDAFGK